jgi:hypothetical protein
VIAYEIYVMGCWEDNVSSRLVIGYDHDHQQSLPSSSYLTCVSQDPSTQYRFVEIELPFFEAVQWKDMLVNKDS